MKKLGNALLLGALAAVLLTAVGCKQEASLGDEAGKWGGQDTSDKSLNKKSLTITADKYDIDFICFVDEDGVVQYPKIYNGEAKEDSITAEWRGLTEDKPVQKGSSIAFDFTDLMGDAGTKKFTLYIWQKNAEPKNGEVGSKDFRGTVTIQDGVGVKIKDSGYKDEVFPVGLAKIKCDEEEGSGSWSGDYTVTRVVPLTITKSVVDGETIVKGTVIDGYTASNVDGLIKYNESKTFLLPAGSCRIAVKQPNRLTEKDKQVLNISNWISTQRENKPNWTFPGDDKSTSDENCQRYVAYQDAALWVQDTDIVIPEHGTYASEIMTSNNQSYIVEGSTDIKPVGKFAAPVEYEIMSALPGEK